MLVRNFRRGIIHGTRMNTGTRRLLLFVFIVLAVPALISQIVPTRTKFNAKPIAQLRARQPDLVFIGDSILGSAIDPRLFEQQIGGGHRVELLWNGGAASASWYLLIKNYLLPSDVRPRLGAIFFRDRMLTDPTFRTTPTYRHYLESLMHEREPILTEVLGTDANKGPVGRFVSMLYPLDERRHVQQERISRIAFRVAAMSPRRVAPLRRRVNEVFDVVRLREEVMPESSAVTAERATTFDPDPKRSFLPHIVDLAAGAGIPLCFVREKRHPEPNVSVPQSDELRRYIADLRAWIESRGCAFLDLSDESEPTPQMFMKENDDHIAPHAKRHSTELYVEKLRPLLQ
jgi:hypothetical protein